MRRVHPLIENEEPASCFRCGTSKEMPHQSHCGLL
jgi:hypothetical protein